MAEPSPDFDILIAGAGAAGLSLAYHLSQDTRCRNLRILLVDRDEKNQNDRTWGYWTAQPQPFDALAAQTYQQAEFISSYYTQTFNLRPYRYHVIRGQDFYRHVLTQLRQHPAFSWQADEVRAIEPLDSGARVVGQQQTYTARWVFSSLFLEEELRQAARHTTVLLQHFKGWVIKTNTAVFQPDRFRMFDFRTPQLNSLRFFYILPYSPTEALVEYTIFSGKMLPANDYTEALKQYIKQHLGSPQFSIQEEEFGVIPMTTYPFKQPHPSIIPVGSVGGASKPSTGYTFRRIQQQTYTLAQQLLRGEAPQLPRTDKRFLVYDNAMLNILDKRGQRGEQVFSELYRNNPPARLLKFLNEETSYPEELQIMQSVPPVLFMRSLANHYLGLPF